MITSELTASPRQIAACAALIYNVLQRGEPRPGSVGMALAMVSAHPGAGVSMVTRLMEELLNENAAGSAIGMDCCSLGSPDAEQSKRFPLSAAPQETERVGIESRTRLGKYRDRADHLNSLRNVYRYVLLDCHSLKEKTDVLGLAPLVDGVLIVLEGDKTTKSQLNYLERSIEEYGGNILGCVLNKRTYPIPNFVFGWMERIGF